MKFRVLAVILTSLILVSCNSAPPGQSLADEYYNLGNEWFDLKKFDKAAIAYQKALGWNPALKIATVNLARTKAELGDSAGALDLLNAVAQSDPDNLVVAQYRAWLTAKRDGTAAAADLYSALAVRLPGDAATQYNAGLSLKEAGRDDEALVALKAWRTLDGKTWAGLSILAETLEKINSPETAGAWLDAASALPENDAKRFAPLVRRAKALEAAELFGDAVQSLTDALTLPSAPDQARGAALFRKGSLLLLRIEDYQEGLRALTEAWKTGYTDADIWKELLEDPNLKFSVKLKADLKLSGVGP